MRRVARTYVAVIFLSVGLVLPSLSVRAADDTILGRVKGSVGYRAPDATQETLITGNQILGDRFFAITGDASQGILKMPDSSVIGLGANTNVQVAAFKRAETGDGTTIVIPTSGGTIRFQVRHPTGARASYTFVTPVATISVRGTIGLVASGANGDTIACLQCAAGDVNVTLAASGRVIPLLTGQTLVVTLAGLVTVGVITATVLESFSSAGLSTSAAAASPVAAGSAAGAAAGTSGAAAGAAAAAVSAGVAAAAVIQAAATTAPAPSPTASSNIKFTGHPK